MANRLYLWGTTATGITPLPLASWSVTGGYVERALNLTSGGGIYETITGPSNTATGLILLGQFQSPPLGAQTITGTVSGVHLASTSNAATSGIPAMAIRVFTSSGTLRGTLLGLTSGNSAATLTTTLTNRFYPSGNALTTVTGQAGDYLVAEFGVLQAASSANKTQSNRFGASGVTDLAFNQTGTNSSLNAWISFSQNLFFQTIEKQNGITRISIRDTNKYHGIAKIKLSSINKNNGKASVRAAVPQKQLGKASIRASVVRKQTGQARILCHTKGSISIAAGGGILSGASQQVGAIAIFDYIAKYFTPSKSSPLSYVVVPLAKAGSPDNQYQISIYSDNAGVPGSVLQSSPIYPASALGLDIFSYLVFNFTGGITLVGGTQYWLVIRAINPLNDNSNYVLWGQGSGSDDYYTSQDGISWSHTFDGATNIFNINGTLNGISRIQAHNPQKQHGLARIQGATTPTNRWRLDDGSGTTAADSAGSFPGTLFKGPAWRGAHGGPVSGSLRFTASQLQPPLQFQSVTITGSTGLMDNQQNFSVSAWLRTQATGGVLISKTDGQGFNNAQGWMMGIGATGEGFFAGLQYSAGAIWQGFNIPSGFICDNKWHNVVLTVQNGLATGLYLDGTTGNSLVDNGGTFVTGNISNTGNIIIGNSFIGEAFVGEIDDVRLYNSTLLASDVTTLYSGATKTPDYPFYGQSFIQAPNHVLPPFLISVSGAEPTTSVSSGFVPNFVTSGLSNSYLLVIAENYEASNNTFNSGSFAGLPLTLLTTGSFYSQQGALQVYGLQNPPFTTGSVSVGHSGITFSFVGLHVLYFGNVSGFRIPSFTGLPDSASNTGVSISGSSVNTDLFIDTIAFSFDADNRDVITPINAASRIVKQISEYALGSAAMYSAMTYCNNGNTVVGWSNTLNNSGSLGMGEIGIILHGFPASQPQKIYGLARVQAHTVQKVYGLARIQVHNTQKLYSLTRIGLRDTNKIYGLLRIQIHSVNKVYGVANIATVFKNYGLARIQIHTLNKVYGVARFQNTTVSKQHGKSRIQTTSTGEVTIFSTLQSTSSFTSIGRFASNTYIASSFTDSINLPVKVIGLFIIAQGSPTYQIQAFIYSDNAGQPGTQIGAGSQLYGSSDLVGLVHPITILKGLNAPLVNGQQYWVVVQAIGSSNDNNNYVNWGLAGATANYYTSSDGITWSSTQSGAGVPFFGVFGPLRGLARIQIHSPQKVYGLARLQSHTINKQYGLGRIDTTNQDKIYGLSRVQVHSQQKQHGIAHILPGSSTNQSKIYGISRIQIHSPFKVYGVARILNHTINKIYGVGRIKIIGESFKQHGLARIQVTNVSKVNGKANLLLRDTPKIHGIARILSHTANKQNGVARVLNHTVNKNYGLARVQVHTLQKQNAVARIAVRDTDKIYGLARTQFRGAYKIYSLARIRNSIVNKELGVGRIQVTNKDKIYGLAHIFFTRVNKENGLSRIQVTQVRKISGLGQVFFFGQTNKKTNGLSRIQTHTVQHQYGLARATAHTVNKIYGVARIIVHTANKIYGLARVTTRTSNKVYGVTRITVHNTNKIYGLARISVRDASKIYGIARVSTHDVLKIYGIARVRATTINKNYGVAHINVAGKTINTIHGKGAIRNSVVQKIYGLARIDTTNAKKILSLARVDVKNTYLSYGLARVQARNTDKTNGIGRIAIHSAQKTHGITRIQVHNPDKVYGVARIQNHVPWKQNALGRMHVATNQKIYGLSHISLRDTDKVYGISRIKVTGEQTKIYGLGRIQTRSIVHIYGIGRIYTITTSVKTVHGLARISVRDINHQQGQTRIRSTSISKVNGQARITQRNPDKILGIAHLAFRNADKVYGLARIKNTMVCKTSGRANITGSGSHKIYGLAKIFFSRQNKINGKASVSGRSTIKITGVARIQVINVQKIYGRFRIAKKENPRPFITIVTVAVTTNPMAGIVVQERKTSNLPIQIGPETIPIIVDIP